MAATRFLLAPISGAFVATSLLYTFRHTIAVQTHDTTIALNSIQLQLNNIDPDNWDKEGKQRVAREQLRPAYVPPTQPTLTEQIKGRWNDHVIGAVNTVANADYYDLLANGFATARHLFSNLGSTTTSPSSNTLVGAPLEAQMAMTGGIKTGVVDTHGVSLREDSSADQAPGSGMGSKIAHATGWGAGVVDKAAEARLDTGFGKVGNGNAGRTFYLGEGTSLR